MKFNSIKFKISVLYTIFLGIILIVYSAVLYLSLRYTLYNELDDELNKKGKEIARTIDSYVEILGYNQRSFNFAVKRVVTLEGWYWGQEKIMELEQQWMQKFDKFGLKGDYIEFLDMKGNIFVKSNNLQEKSFLLSLQDRRKIEEGKILFKNIKLDRRNLRVISIPFSHVGSEQYVIQVGTSLKPLINLLHVRVIHITISIPIILLFASFLGRIFAYHILRPVVEITEAASKITHQDLSSRVKIEHVDEEMKYLVTAFNDMISRLQQSFNYITALSSHVAHDLKTPLAIIRGEVDLALRKDRSPEEYKRVLKVNSGEAERMLKVIDDLLLLTKLDYCSEFFKFKEINLNEFLWEIYEQAKILVLQKSITVNINLPQEQMLIYADKVHLRRLFFNLIDNAIKFNEREGKINIDVEKSEEKVVVVISDTGIGIASENLSKIFERFFRIDKQDEQIDASTGLGLSIAQSVAKIHHGSILVESVPKKGSVFRVVLPLL